jgi:hypothetical protein
MEAARRDIGQADSSEEAGSPAWWEARDPGMTGLLTWVNAFRAARVRRALAALSADCGHVITAKEAASVPAIVVQVQLRTSSPGTVASAADDADLQFPSIAQLRWEAGASPRDLLARVSLGRDGRSESSP